MKANFSINALIFSVAIFFGALGAGYLIANMLYKAKTADRYVSVKGLVLREVKADLAIWNINFREVGSDLIDVNNRTEEKLKLVKAFLKDKGFKDEELEVQPSVVTDLMANQYSSSTNDPTLVQRRFIIASGMRVRTPRVDLVAKVTQEISALLQQGVSLNFENFAYAPNPSYIFTRLDEIRPTMLADATKSAHLVAQQFAKDSGSSLGKIRRANQGQFQVMSRDSTDVNSNQSELGSIYKKIRLVTTIDYSLER